MPRQLMPQPPQRRKPEKPSLVDPKIWRACAGASVQIPAVDSRVYYFPQGHMDQASSPPQNLSPLLLSRPFILCKVSAVQFLADPLTDEVFAKLLLRPLTKSSAALTRPPPPPPDDDNKVMSYAKILTPSDANNGGGFSVPRCCADSIFPTLNYENDHPVQTLSITDVHGEEWQFRHIYRGTPKRHLLTTGWSTFVNTKNLVAGDSVIFMKNSSEKMFVGIRRATRFASGWDGARSFILGVRNRVQEEHQQQEEKTNKEVFSRNGKGKLSAKSVAEAAELAAQNMPFEVVYYPKAGWSDFVVKAETVDEAMMVAWSPGIRVKMAVEADDLTKMTWFQGVVCSVSVPPDNVPWRGSPWRMLQGARHDLFSASSFSNFPSDKFRLCMGYSSMNNTVPGLKAVSTELNVGSSQSDDLNPHRQSSLHSSGTEYVGNHNCSSTKPVPVSFQLFGTVIETNRLAENGSHNTGCAGDKSSKGGNENEGIDNRRDDSGLY
ncbi:DNA-binding barrel domain superfamily [Sesbania bispinosa]|nr:DNA-binding barrel domain superfamily [Sesbania bispinosa]